MTTWLQGWEGGVLTLPAGAIPTVGASAKTVNGLLQDVGKGSHFKDPCSVPTYNLYTVD